MQVEQQAGPDPSRRKGGDTRLEKSTDKRPLGLGLAAASAAAAALSLRLIQYGISGGNSWAVFYSLLDALFQIAVALAAVLTAGAFGLWRALGDTGPRSSASLYGALSGVIMVLAVAAKNWLFFENPTKSSTILSLVLDPALAFIGFLGSVLIALSFVGFLAGLGKSPPPKV